MRARRLHWAAHKRSARAMARALLHHPQMMATSSYAFRRWKYRRVKPLTPTISAARKRSPYGAVLPVSGKVTGTPLVVVVWVVVMPVVVVPVVVVVVVVVVQGPTLKTLVFVLSSGVVTVTLTSWDVG